MNPALTVVTEALKAFVTVYIVAAVVKSVANQVYALASTASSLAGGECQSKATVANNYMQAYIATQQIPLASKTFGKATNLEQSILMLRCVMWTTGVYMQTQKDFPQGLVVPSSPVQGMGWRAPIVDGIEESPKLWSILVSDDGETAIITLRGSKTAYDWKSVDFQVNQTDITVTSTSGVGLPMRVHSGFLAVAEEVIHSFQTQCDVKAVRQLYVAGHSLGAAVTTVVAMLVANTARCSVKMFAYAPPYAGDQQFAAAFARVGGYMFVNAEDVVPQTPLPITLNSAYPNSPPGAPSAGRTYFHG